MLITGAQAVVECLKEQGVDIVYGYPGGMILPLYDALCQDQGIQHVLTVHEQGAAHAADGYARASGRVGVCIATSGPGATNLVTGLATAFMDSIPVVAITGQVPTWSLGTDAFQEADIVGMTMGITKHNYLVRDPQKISETIRQAFRLARSGRPGPVLVDIPRDILLAPSSFSHIPGSSSADLRLRCEQPLPFTRVAEVLKSAQKPLLLLGGGVISGGAAVEVRQLAEKCNLPVVSTLMGLGAFPSSHPQMLGLTGLHGHKTANHAVYDADVIIVVGSRFSDRATSNRERYAAEKIVIHLDVDPAEIDKNVLSHIGMAGDIRQILRRMVQEIDTGDIRDWWESIRQWQTEFADDYCSAPLGAPWMMQCLSEVAPPETIYVTDVGQHQMWAAQHLRIEQPRTWLTSGGFGAMGFCIPAAIGAQMAMPDKPVVAIVGDGGFKMTGNELYTMVTQQLPITIIVVNNNGLGMIRQLQQVFFDKRYYSCCLPEMFDFIRYGEVFGIVGQRVNSAGAFQAAVADAVAARAPRLIVADIDSENMVKPQVYPNAAINDFFEFDN